MECLLPYLSMVTVPHIMVGLERMLDYRGVGLGGCWIMECLLPYLSMVTVPHIMVGLERMLDYRGVGLERFHCTCVLT